MGDWMRLTAGKYRTRHNGETWYLKATPGERWAWLLYTERDGRKGPELDQSQPIQAGNDDDAQGRAQAWLDQGKYTRRIGS